jgi:hypothetical protein
MLTLRKLTFLVVATAGAALAQTPVTTTVADQLFMAVGGPTYCSGTITISWPDFYSEDAYMIKAGTLSTAVNSTGNFSVALVPTNTNLTPAAGIYGIRYNLQPAGCAATSEAWNVPSSGSPVDLNMVRALPSPPPSLIPVTSLAPPLSNANSALCFSGGYVLWSSICTSSGSPITGSGTAGKLAKFTAAMVIGNAGYADVVANWTGCSGTEYLGFDGNCHTPISQLTATAIIGLWSGCSGTDYLGADGGCHTSGGMIYPGAGVPCSTGSAWCTSYSATTLTAFLNPFSSSLQGAGLGRWNGELSARGWNVDYPAFRYRLPWRWSSLFDRLCLVHILYGYDPHGVPQSVLQFAARLGAFVRWRNHELSEG